MDKTENLQTVLTKKTEFTDYDKRKDQNFTDSFKWRFYRLLYCIFSLFL